MKISLPLLQENTPQAVHQAYDAKALDLEFVDLAYLQDVVLDGTVEKQKDTLTFRGRLVSRVEHTCARCLKGIEEKVERPFETVYDIRGKQEIDTLDDLREILILDHSLRYLCREACRGLCPQCGKDLNEGACACPPAP